MGLSHASIKITSAVITWHIAMQIARQGQNWLSPAVH